MDAELLVTGDEITRGSVVDTNSSWLLQRLWPLGAKVRRVTAVGDVADDLAAAIRDASERTQLLIISGGLGPTSDDLTAEIAARVADVPLEVHEPTLERIAARWARRQKPMPPMVARQASVPLGASILTNDEGTAPGFHLRIGKAECFFFAGVPREFKHLVETHLLPWLGARSDHAVVTQTLRYVNVPESELDAALLPVAEKHGLRLGLRAAYPETWVSFTSEGSTADEAQSRLAPAIDEALRLTGTHCYSSTAETLAFVIGRLLKAANWTVSVAESCTGGLLGAEITSIGGSSAYFMGGAQTYANEEKTRALGVPADVIAKHGAVSEQVARAMAEGARTRLNTTCALSITGVAGPGGGTPEKPVGMVWIGLATPTGTVAEVQRFTRSDRESIRQASVASALELLRRTLVERPS